MVTFPTSFSYSRSILTKSHSSCGFLLSSGPWMAAAQSLMVTGSFFASGVEASGSVEVDVEGSSEEASEEAAAVAVSAPDVPGDVPQADNPRHRIRKNRENIRDAQVMVFLFMGFPFQDGLLYPGAKAMMYERNGHLEKSPNKATGIWRLDPSDQFLLYERFMLLSQ